MLIEHGSYTKCSKNGFKVKLQSLSMFIIYLADGINGYGARGGEFEDAGSDSVWVECCKSHSYGGTSYLLVQTLLL